MNIFRAMFRAQTTGKKVEHMKQGSARLRVTENKNGEKREQGITNKLQHLGRRTGCGGGLWQKQAVGCIQNKTPNPKSKRNGTPQAQHT